MLTPANCLRPVEESEQLIIDNERPLPKIEVKLFSIKCNYRSPNQMMHTLDDEHTPCVFKISVNFVFL